MIGGPGLEEALRERGLEPVFEPSDDVAAVAQGYGPDMPWKRVVAGRDPGARRAAVGGQQHRHDDPDGDRAWARATGRWSRLVAEFTGREPQVAGKPMKPLFEETIARVGGRPPAGDRRPARHRHRGRRDDGLGQPAGADRGHRARGARPGGARTSDRRTSARDLGALAEAQPAPEVRDDDGHARRLDAPRSTDGRLVVEGRRVRRRLVAGRRRSPRGAISTTRDSLSTPMTRRPPE